MEHDLRPNGGLGLLIRPPTLSTAGQPAS